MNEIEFKDLPQLIVALDSNDDSANYIHIKDAKDIEYYCPCCKGKVKPRANKDDKSYKVQPHYYHINGGCSEETYVHYICKNWLFEKGCKFIVNNTEYEVDHIDTEKTLHTSFGNYRPDIIVFTTNGKVFYFEIKTTNKKTELYAPKWDELGNDVVEVDTKYFINQKYSSSIPEFKLIYSDGECFIKSYTKKDYDNIIAKRKLEWKRQDKLNYKIKWEKLDWFWIELQEYLKNNYNIDNLYNAFCLLEQDDAKFCINILKKHNNTKYVYKNIMHKINKKEMEILHDEKLQQKVKENKLELYHMLLLTNKDLIKKKIDELNNLYNKYNLTICFPENDFAPNSYWIILNLYYNNKYAIDRLDLYSKHFDISFFKQFSDSDIDTIINQIEYYYKQLIYNLNQDIYFSEWKNIVDYFSKNFINKYKNNKNVIVSINKLNWNNATTISFSILDNNGYILNSQNLIYVSSDYKELRIYYGCNENEYDEFNICCFNIDDIYNIFNINKNKVLSDYIKNLQDRGIILVKEIL